MKRTPRKNKQMILIVLF